MSTWTLAAIRSKIRNVSGRISTNELSNNQLDTYLNQYLQYKFPAEAKLEREHTYYEFLTTVNQAYYDSPDASFTNFEPPATMDNLSLYWYQDPGRFNDENFYNVSRLTQWTGDGVTSAFSTTITGNTIFPGTTVITDNVEIFEDTNNNWTTSNVTLTGTLGGSGTINYVSGAINVTFASAPANGQNIYLSYILFIPGRPTSVLWYNNQFQFYPIPDTSYRFKVKAYGLNLVTTAAGVTQTTFINSTDRPLLDYWGPCLAYGTVREIYADFGETEARNEITPLYKEELAGVLRRTHQNLLNTRSMPMF